MGTAVATKNTPAAAPAASVPAKKTSLEANPLWKEMPIALRDKAIDIHKLVLEETETTVKTRWKIGSHIDEVKTGPEKHGPESTSLRSLATVLNLNKDTLSQAHRFFSLYTQTALDELLAARTKKGTSLEWCHVRELLRVGDSKARKQFQAQILKEDLTVADLHTRVNAFLGGGTPGTPTTGVIMAPKTLDGALKQVKAVVSTFQARQGLWGDPDKGLAALFENLPPDKIDEDLLKALEDAEGDLANVQSSLEAPVRELRKVRLKAEQKLKNQKPAKAKEDPPEDDEPLEAPKAKPEAKSKEEAKAEAKPATKKGKPSDEEEE